ncbi:hypothetical protein BZA05DRAFT_393525 [Tricharina praecox]|uniref:uncharacterized protein n=1 Tax=Tricharina praecox TaxID=43433 RepID=UPI002220A141|nr:uncharacterized protein BZA05DRAFT_393525 [Tricharina praecox]KAI5854208.1 hypothetical protein BZA05DRAFT_393525 [Tricharina praecox]
MRASDRGMSVWVLSFFTFFVFLYYYMASAIRYGGWLVGWGLLHLGLFSSCISFHFVTAA